MDFNANDIGFVPSNAPHYVENTGETDLAFLGNLCVKGVHGCFSESMAQARPSEMLKAHLNIDKATAMKIPAEKLAVI
ncbi:MAG: hypothetical protein WB660_16265 [Candidatus Sulfotelmatobacter sp.]